MTTLRAGAVTLALFSFVSAAFAQQVDFSLEETLSVDAVAVIRPQLDRAHIARGITRVSAHEGKLYNFDFDFKTRRGNAAFDEHMLDYRWRWVQPTPLVDTNWADHDGDGKDDYPDSCLDFAFVGAGAYNRHAKSRVIVREGDFPDDETTSDHRPVELRVPLT